METKERFIVETTPARGRALRGVLTVLWHGAGGDIDERTLAGASRAFAEAGAVSARARFPYRAHGRRAPDRMPALLRSAKEVIEEIRSKHGRGIDRLILGGRSMGGRVASMLVGDGFHADGLVFLSYPLHPAGHPEKPRDAHLASTRCPLLFVQGDRDDLCRLDLLRPVLDRIGARATLALFPGADHSFRKVPVEDVSTSVLEWTLRILRR